MWNFDHKHNLYKDDASYVYPINTELSGKHRKIARGEKLGQSYQLSGKHRKIAEVIRLKLRNKSSLTCHTVTPYAPMMKLVLIVLWNTKQHIKFMSI